MSPPSYVEYQLVFCLSRIKSILTDPDATSATQPTEPGPEIPTYLEGSLRWQAYRRCAFTLFSNPRSHHEANFRYLEITTVVATGHRGLTEWHMRLAYPTNPETPLWYSEEPVRDELNRLVLRADWWYSCGIRADWTRDNAARHEMGDWYSNRAYVIRILEWDSRDDPDALHPNSPVLELL